MKLFRLRYRVIYWRYYDNEKHVCPGHVSLWFAQRCTTRKLKFVYIRAAHIEWVKYV